MMAESERQTGADTMDEGSSAEGLRKKGEELWRMMKDERHRWRSNEEQEVDKGRDD